MREIQNLKEGWRYALIGDGVLLGMKDGLKQTLKFSATAMVMMPLVLPYYINSSHIIIIMANFYLHRRIRSEIYTSVLVKASPHSQCCLPTYSTYTGQMQP